LVTNNKPSRAVKLGRFKEVKEVQEMNHETEAKKIIYDHTTGYLYEWYDTDEIINNMTHDEMCEIIRDECGFILAEKWINGEYNTRDYFAIRNELGKLIDKITEESGA
jgi:hypothetical protein